MTHVERHNVVKLDALVGRRGAQSLPVHRHLSTTYIQEAADISTAIAKGCNNVNDNF